MNYWQVFISNFESRFIFCFVYLLGMAGYDYRVLKAGRKKNSPETLRPDKKTQESIQKQKTPITNNIDPKTLMSNYVAPQKQETQPQPIAVAEAPSKPDANKNNQKEISLNLFDDMMKEEEEKEIIENREEPQDQEQDGETAKKEKLRIYKIEQELKAEKERQEALEYGEEVY